MVTPDNSQPFPSEPPDQTVDLNRQNRIQPCSTCRELILRGAKKCTQCDSYQDWRKHLTGSTAILALILSALAGLTAAGPVIYQAWRKADSDLSISSVSLIQYGKVYVLLTNSGKMPGAVSVMTIELPIKDERRVIWLHPIMNGPNAGVIPPDGAVERTFQGNFSENYVTVPEGWDPKKMLKESDLDTLKQAMDDIEKGDGLPKCKAVIDVTSFKGESNKIKKNFDCRSLKDMLYVYWKQVHPQG